MCSIFLPCDSGDITTTGVDGQPWDPMVKPGQDVVYSCNAGAACVDGLRDFLSGDELDMISDANWSTVDLSGWSATPCTPPLNFVGTGSHETHTFVNVQWGMAGKPLSANTVWYNSQGNELDGLTIDVTRRWQWLDPKAEFACNEFHFPLLPVVRQYHAIQTQGKIVPY